MLSADICKYLSFLFLGVLSVKIRWSIIDVCPGLVDRGHIHIPATAKNDICLFLSVVLKWKQSQLSRSEFTGQKNIYEHNHVCFLWSTIILHRLSQDLIGNSKYDYSLRKPPMCSSASSFVQCTCFTKDGSDWTSEHVFSRTIELHGEWENF